MNKMETRVSKRDKGREGKGVILVKKAHVNQITSRPARVVHPCLCA